MKRIPHLYSQIISIENLLASWEEFVKGKKKKADVHIFSHNLFQNIFDLHNDLSNFTYLHANYERFKICDPKQRTIHKASVRDRVVYHAIYRILYPIFDRSFIFDSYSCRTEKGTHKAVDRLEYFVRKVSRNYSSSCFALKCDVKKFFDSVDHKILLDIIKIKISDQQTLCPIEEVINSFNRSYIQQSLFERERESSRSLAVIGKGIPIGNLTSQLFANIYLDEFDQFIKHKLKVKYYLRYCDDFVIVDNNQMKLEKLIPDIAKFLRNELKLELHPIKVTIRKLKQGIDFLGYIVLLHYRILRTKTKRRMFKQVNANNISSYLGLLKHCCGYELERQISLLDSLYHDSSHN